MPKKLEMISCRASKSAQNSGLGHIPQFVSQDLLEGNQQPFVVSDSGHYKCFFVVIYLCMYKDASLRRTLVLRVT